MPTFAVTVELFYNGVWNNITALGHVYERAGVDITWGRQPGGSAPEQSTLKVTLNNRDGRYSPRNPASPLHEKIGRNTPIRVTLSGTQAFIGEVSSWPLLWDLSGNDRWVPIVATGILRRINQGTQPVWSGLKSYLLDSAPVTYWPCDDGTDSVKAWPAAGSYQGSSLYEHFTTTVFATFGEGLLASHLASTMTINDTTTGAFTGVCKGSSAAPNDIAFEFVYRSQNQGSSLGTWVVYLEMGSPTAPPGDLTNADDVFLVTLNAGVNRVDLGTVIDGGVGPGASTGVGAVPFNDGGLHHVRVQATQSGADVAFKVYFDGVDTGITATAVAHTLRRTNRMVVQYDRAPGQDLLNFGHLIVWENTVNIPPIATTSGLAFGFAGEPAGRRIERLCAEQGVGFDAAGVNLDDSMPMGVQFEDDFSAQLAECEATDMGLIYEQRGSATLGYRTRASLYAQTPVAVINHELGELSAPFEPVDDDQATRNDVFAQRRNGGSARATLDVGRLSVQAPPNGVGRYKDEYQVNCQTDGMLDGIAWWRVHLGTIDAARFPSVTVNRARAAVAGSPLGLSTLIRAVNVGDLIRITGGAKLRTSAGVYDDIDLLVLGGQITADGFDHTLTFNCVPYEPYAVAKYGTDRFDTAGSTLASAPTPATTGTTLSVASPQTLWTTDVAAFPFDINVAGERMTVTNITGATSPQSFTVQRSKNGVVKAQASGAAVRLFKTPRYAL